METYTLGQRKEGSTPGERGRRGARAYNGDLGIAPSVVQGQSPWSEGQGRNLPEAESFWFLEVQRNDHLSPSRDYTQLKEFQNICNHLQNYMYTMA